MSASHIPAKLRRVIRAIARDRCEYCQSPEFLMDDSVATLLGSDEETSAAIVRGKVAMRWKFKTSQKQLDKMLEEATVDCYDEYEAFTGVVITLADNLPFPFEAKVIGETVQVIGIDDSRSNMKRGIIARVRKGGKEHNVAFSELAIPKKLKTNKWFELYEYWARGF